MTPGWRSLPPGLLALALVLAAGGCAPADPLETRIPADSAISYAMWESDTLGRLTPEQMEDYRDALQEIRFRAMGLHGASGHEAVEASLRRTIDGMTLRQVILQGLGWKVARLDAQRAELAKSIALNARIRTHPEDTASQNYLEEFHDRLVKQMNETIEAGDRARRRMAADAGKNREGD